MKLSLSIIFLFITSLLLAQQNTSKISGYVKDAETDLPIERASVELKNSKNVVITDKYGYFEITIYRIPAILKISHICYNETKINVTKADSISFEIKLKYKINLLKSVNIKDKTIERISRNTQLWAYDYEFFNDNILILNLKNILSNSFLYLVNFDGDTLNTLDLKRYKIKPIKLFKDCLDNIHVITRDSAYQIQYSKKEGLELKYPTEIKKFEYLLSTCITSIDSCVYYQYYFLHDFASQCYYINVYNKEKEFTIRTIFDTISIDRFERRFDRSFYMKLYHCAVNDDMLQYFRYAQPIGDTDKFMYPTIYTPLINRDDTLCIFNHCYSQIEYFSKSGNFIKKIPINYHKLNDWDKKIYLDPKTNKIYAQYLLKKSIYSLREINTKDGTIIKTLPIPELPFIENIKVFNNYVYFLYRNRSMGIEDNKMLYRMRIQ